MYADGCVFKGPNKLCMQQETQLHRLYFVGSASLLAFGSVAGFILDHAGVMTLVAFATCAQLLGLLLMGAGMIFIINKKMVEVKKTCCSCVC